MKEEQRAQRKVEKNTPKEPGQEVDSDIMSEAELAELRQQEY
jgi:hypothetical protein